MPELLIENMPFVAQLVEDATPAGTKRLVVRGQFGLADVPTSNKRLYRESLWKREFKRLAESLDDRRLFGECDHPADGKTKLQRASHLITRLEIKNGEVVGEAEILPTPMGRILEAIMQTGAKVGVSSRGYGSTMKDDDGNDVVGEDFKLLSFDFVADPATKTAYPKVFAEAEEIAQTSDAAIREVVPDEIVERFDRLEADVKKLLQEDTADTGVKFTEEQLQEAIAEERRRMADVYADRMVEAAAAIKEAIEEDVRAEMRADPNVAASHALVEEIGRLLRPHIVPGDFEAAISEAEAKTAEALALVEEKDSRLAQALRERDEAIELGRRAAIEARLVESFSKYENADFLRMMMEDRIARATTLEEVDTLAAQLCAQVGKLAGVADPVIVTQLQGQVTTLEAQVEDVGRLRNRVAVLEGLLSEAAPRLEGIGRIEAENRRLSEEVATLKQRAQTRLEESERADQRHRAATAADGAKMARYRKIVEQAVGKKMVKLIDEGASADEVDAALLEDAQRRADPERNADVRETVRRGLERNVHEDEFGGGGSRGDGPEAVAGTGLQLEEFDRLAEVGASL